MAMQRKGIRIRTSRVDLGGLVDVVQSCFHYPYICYDAMLTPRIFEGHLPEACLCLASIRISLQYLAHQDRAV